VMITPRIMKISNVALRRLFAIQSNLQCPIALNSIGQLTCLDSAPDAATCRGVVA